MCYYRFYVFLGCGHHTFSRTPVSYCKAAKTNASADSNIPLNQDERANIHDPGCGSAKGDEDGRTDGDSSLPDARSIGTPECSIAGSTTNPSTTVETETVDARDTKPATPVIKEPCDEGRVHPLHTFKLERVCPGCARDRDKRLHQLDGVTDEIKFDAGKWHCKYQGHSSGKDGNGEGKADTGWKVGAAIGEWLKDRSR